MKAYTKKRLTKAGWLLFYLYIILLSYFLFFSEHYGRGDIASDYRYNLVFFKEINRFIMYRQQLGFESFVVNILGNILAFAPFGFMLPLLNIKYRRFFMIVFTSMLFSLAIETVQLVLKVGIFDVDDIMMNALGGVIGYLFYRICSSIFQGAASEEKEKQEELGMFWNHKKEMIHFSGRRHTKTGIFSTVIGIVTILGFIAVSIASGVAGGNGGILLGIFGFLIFALSVFGFVLSYRSFRKKDIFYGFPILGGILNGLMTILLLVLYIIGVSV